MSAADCLQEPSHRLAEPPRRVPLPLAELVKFVTLAALLAMFADAAVAHAMLWGNDPYWTYWVTDALLMATVFGVGTAWFGIGLKRGAVMTAIHVVILTTYYWTLSPIGLPAQAEWLDLERTWLTGLSVHFAVYYLGYVLAVWLRNRARRLGAQRAAETRALGPTATLALGLATAVVIVLGLLQAVITGQFPGVTWFIVRVAIMTPLVLAWWAMAGTDRTAAAAGGVMLGFLLITYGHYLSPAGLPNSSLRLLSADPPGTLVQWLPYRVEFLVLLPLALVLTITAMLFASLWHRRQSEPAPVRSGFLSTSSIAAVAGLIVLGGVAAFFTGPEAHRTQVSSLGEAAVEAGAPFAGDLVPVTATLTMLAENRNTHRTPLPPHDGIDIQANITGPDGRIYNVEVTQPLVADPRGRYTTWAGAGFDVWHHGRSGIGSSALPPMNSPVAVFALGSVSVDGEVTATGVPVHIGTSTQPDRRLELHVGDVEAPVPGLPDGQLRVVWNDYSGGNTRGLTNARYALGGGMLLVLLGFALALARRSSLPAQT